MKEIQTFMVRYTQDSFEGCPPVVGFTELGNLLTLVGEDRVVTERKEIQIKFDYPLTNPVMLTFHSPTGFTLSKFWEAVYQGYVAIYAEEEQASPPKYDESSMLINRPTTTGKYGIRGHVIEDLALEGFVEVKPGVFELHIGS